MIHTDGESYDDLEKLIKRELLFKDIVNCINSSRYAAVSLENPYMVMLTRKDCAGITYGTYTTPTEAIEAVLYLHNNDKAIDDFLETRTQARKKIRNRAK